MSKRSDPAQGKHNILILNLEDEEDDGLFDSIYSDLIESLAAKYRIQRTHKPDAAQRYLSNSENRPIAILIVDAGVVEAANITVLNQVKEYVRGGGIAVFMASFSSFVRPLEMNIHWKEHWGLDWQFGDYYRTDVHLNR
jgi:hypothetical protein